jgi:MFS family permease
MSSAGTRPVPRGVHTGSLLYAATAGIALLMLVNVLAAWSHYSPASAEYRYVMEAAEFDADEQLWMVGSSLAIAAIGAALALLAGGFLAVAVRRPRRWIQIAAWCASAGLAVLLLLNLMSVPDINGADLREGAKEVDRLWHNLLPGWYLSVNALLGAALLVTVAAAGLVLARSSVTDFYRAASHIEDANWSSFVDRQRSTRMGTDSPASPEGPSAGGA